MTVYANYNPKVQNIGYRTLLCDMCQTKTSTGLQKLLVEYVKDNHYVP